MGHRRMKADPYSQTRRNLSRLPRINVFALNECLFVAKTDGNKFAAGRVPLRDHGAEVRWLEYRAVICEKRISLGLSSNRNVDVSLRARSFPFRLRQQTMPRW